MILSKLAVAAVAGMALLAFTASRVAAQGAPKAGEMAPDFTLHGASQNGLLTAPIKLSDLRGQVVVLAFFPKARTGG